MAEVNQAERAFRAWPILTERAQQATTITYADLASMLAIHVRPIRYVLSLIQDYCLEEKLPPLTILVVNQSGAPGPGFIAWDIDDLDEGLRKVYAYRWDQIENPFQFASNGETLVDLAERLVMHPNQATDVYAQVRVRGTAQGVFREALLRAYNYTCAFSGISVEDVLEAVHILPWSKCNPSERLDIRNGLLLTSLHHSLFDSGLITVSPDYKVHVMSDLQRHSHSPVGKALFADLDGRLLRLPKRKTLWPSPEFIKRRNEVLKH